MAKNNLNLSEQQVISLLWEESVLDDKENEIFEFIDKNSKNQIQKNPELIIKLLLRKLLLVNTGKQF